MEEMESGFFARSKTREVNGLLVWEDLQAFAPSREFDLAKPRPPQKPAPMGFHAMAPSRLEAPTRR
jgi:hypothetical protein